MRCVFDTNVSISALLSPESKPRQAVDLASQKGTILLSFAVLAELNEVLGRKQFRRYIDEGEIRRFLAALTRESEWIDVDVPITACRDPKDDKFLSLAVSGHATHIVTGDADLLTHSRVSKLSSRRRFLRKKHGSGYCSGCRSRLACTG